MQLEPEMSSEAGYSPSGAIEVDINRQYQALVDASSQIVWSAPPQGLLEVVDMPYWRRYTGQMKEEIPNRGWLNAVHTDDREQTVQIFESALQNHQPVKHDLRIRRRDGIYHWFRNNGVPVFEDDHNIKEWVGICTDITVLKDNETQLEAAREEMNQKHQFLCSIFDAIADGIFVYDTQGNILKMNKTMEDILESSLIPSFSSLPMNERHQYYQYMDEDGNLLPHEDWPVSRIFRGETFANSSIAHNIVRTASGRLKYVSTSGAPVYRGAERIGAVLVIRDETEIMEQAKIVRTSLETVIEMARLMLKEVNQPSEEEISSFRFTDGIGQKLAHQACVVLHCKYAAILAFHPETEVMHILASDGEDDQIQEQRRQRMNHAKLSDIFDREQIHRLRQGEDINLIADRVSEENHEGNEETLVEPMIIDDKLVGLIHFEPREQQYSFKVNERKLARAVADFAAIVFDRERTLRIHAATVASERNLYEDNRRMDEFLSIASHELKTPLTSVKTYVQLCEKRLKTFGTKLETAQQGLSESLKTSTELLENADVQIRRMTNLINDLLDVTRIQSGNIELKFDWYRPADLIRAIVAEYQLSFPRRKFIVDVAACDGISLYLDKDKISQVLLNFLSNARKYSSVDKPISLICQCSEDTLKVLVRDEGKGISPEDQQHLWKRFHRIQASEAVEAETRTTNEGGLGLGLYICATFIKYHNGEVGVESELEKGSTFWFTLPLGSSPQSPSPDGSQPLVHPAQ